MSNSRRVVVSCVSAPLVLTREGQPSSPFQDSSSPSAVINHLDDSTFHCPFRIFDDCRDGVRGRGFTRSSLISHIHDRHFGSAESRGVCRARIGNDADIYDAWEVGLRHLKMWLCGECMHLRAWSRPCRDHGDTIAGPLDGNNATFLIHGIIKPSLGSLDAGIEAIDEEANVLTLEVLDAIFKKQVQTTASIPPSCRLNFSRTLKATIDKILAKPTEVTSWIKLLLLPSCTLTLYYPKNTNEARSANRRRLQANSINRALNVWRETNGCLILARKLLGPSGQDSRQPTQGTKRKKTNLQACKRKLASGHYAAAVRILSSSGVAPNTSETVNELRRMHPAAEPPDIPSEQINGAAVYVDAKEVLVTIRSFPRGTSCGRDGLRAQHLVDALSGAATAVADDLLASMAGVVNLWLAGRCPSVLGEFVASAPLTPLLKPGGGLKPIAVGTVWRRMCSKLAASAVGKEMAVYLGNHQFGVGIPGGGEAILHSANRLLESKGRQGNMTMLLVDFTNAFNLVDMSTLIKEVRSKCPGIARWVEFCYAKPARLYYNDFNLSSAKGVQQGDPLGPLLFALALHPMVCMITSQCKLDLQAWYLDDGTLVGDTLEVSKALSIIQSEGDNRGLHLNIKKTEIFWPVVDTRSLADNVFPTGIGRPSRGVKLLGGSVSLDLNFSSDIIQARVDKTIYLMESVKKLQDPQSELLLLRSCAGVSRLYFAMRTASPLALLQAKSLFDQRLMFFLRHIVTGDGAGFGPLQQRLSTLPMKDGGLGVYTMEDTSQYCYIASCFQTRGLQRTMLNVSPEEVTSECFKQALTNFLEVCGLPSSTFNINNIAPHPMRSLAVLYFNVVKKRIPSQYYMSSRDSVLWQSNRMPHALDFLKAIPISGLNQSIGPRQFRSVLSYRLGIPLFGEDSTCSSCNKNMDIFGDHAVHCANDVGNKFRHDLARDVFADICYKAGVHVRKEVDLGLFSDNNTPLRPADILVHGWENGQDVCFDVTVVSPFTGGGARTFIPGQAISIATTRKRIKYLDKCSTNGYGFAVLAFTTLGELGEDTIILLKRLKNCITNQDVNHKIGGTLFNRIGLAIQKGVGAQLVARLPTNFL